MTNQELSLVHVFPFGSFEPKKQEPGIRKGNCVGSVAPETEPVYEPANLSTNVDWGITSLLTEKLVTSIKIQETSKDGHMQRNFQATKN